MRLFFSLLAVSLLASPALAQSSMAPIDITPKGQMVATPYYGSGSLGAMPNSGMYANSDDLYSRTGSGEGFHGGGNVYGFNNPAPVGTMTVPTAGTRITDQNFTFVGAAPAGTPNSYAGIATNEPVFAPAIPQGNVQGYDNKPTGSYYDGAPREEWSNTRTMQEWRDQTKASAMPAVKDNAYFSGLDATPQQHEPYYIVASNNADWTLMWQQHMGREPPGRLIPGQVAVASILGPRSYTGYEARVKVVGEDGQRVQVLATQATPAPQVAQTRQNNTPYAVLVVHAGSRGVVVVQNRAINTGNYNYADDPKAKAIAWDPAQLYGNTYSHGVVAR